MEHDKQSMDELLARGIKSVPVTILDDKVVIGFNPQELAKLFDLSGDIPVADVYYGYLDHTVKQDYLLVLEIENSLLQVFSRSTGIPFKIFSCAQ